MGSYVTFQGDMTISREKLPEFNERVLTILDQGGMMGIERVELYGKRIALLTPPEPDEARKVVCCYNYFEDDGWDSICYDTKTGQFTSQDVGCLQFREVVCAVCVPYEFYTAAMAYCDSEPFNKSPYIGWLNYLFDEKFSDERTGSGAPTEKIPTVLFLSCKGSFVDDQLPLWKPIGDVCVSPETQRWLQELREELEAIRSSAGRPLGSKTTLDALI